MANYAMICNGDLIDVVYNCEIAPEWPPDPFGNIVTAIECDPEVTRDWTYNPETNEFAPRTYEEPIPEPKQPTQLDAIEETQLTIMTAMAEQYEESLERELINMEVQATIYEAILELGGAE